MQIIIDIEFETLIPSLTENEHNLLKASILKNGCLHPLLTWNDILIDGHNRYDICIENNIEYKTHNIDFKDRDEAKIFIIDNQLGKRNLEPYQKYELVKIGEEIIKRKAKENQKNGGSKGGKSNGDVQYKQDVKVHSTLNEPSPINTLTELSNKSGLSTGTIHKSKVIDKFADEETKENLRQGKTTINKEYKKINNDTIKRVSEPNLLTFLNAKEERVFKFIIVELDRLAKDNETTLKHELITLKKYLDIELAK